MRTRTVDNAPRDHLAPFLRGAVAVVTVVAAAAFWPPALESFSTVKAAVVVAGAASVAAVVLVDGAVRRQWRVPAGPPARAAAVFVGALACVVVASPSAARALIGPPGRHTGAVLYGAAVTWALVAARAFAGARPVVLVDALLVAAVPVGGYALLQAAGADPLQWVNVEGTAPVFSTFGNVDFVAAWCAIVVPVGVWASTTPARATAARVAAAGATGLAVGAAVASGAAQGIVAAACGSVVVVVARASRTPPSAPGHRRLVPMVTVLAAVALAAAAAGPAALREVSEGLASRTGKYEAALAMAAEEPLLGVGLGAFEDRWFAVRSPQVAAADGLRRSVDSPHAVPLAMLAEGGLALLGAWLAVLGVVAAAARRGWRRLRGDDRVLLAALIGAEVAYLAQSVVSIDVAPLLVVHATLAGTLWGWAGGWGWRPARAPSDGGSDGRWAQRGVEVVASFGVALAMGAVAWWAWVPVRADVAAARAVALAGSGDVAGAQDAFDRAAALAPWDARYPALEGGWHARSGRPADALAAHREALRRRPDALAHALGVARAAVAAGDEETAAAAYDRVSAIDSTTPAVIAEVAAFRERGDGTPATSPPADDDDGADPPEDGPMWSAPR